MNPRKTLPWSIAWRFLRGRNSRLLDGTARAALIATTLGVTALVVAMALMTGYRKDLQQKLVRGNAAVMAYPIGGGMWDLEDETRRAIESIPGVEGLRRVSYGQGALASRHLPDGVEVTLRGVEPGHHLGSLGQVNLEPGFDPAGDWTSGDVPALVVGSSLLRRLDPEPGEPLRLMVLGAQRGRPRFRYSSARSVGTFTTGFSEFDQAWVVASRSLLERLSGGGEAMELFEIGVSDLSAADHIGQEVESILGDDFLVVDWRSLNRELFTALKVQQIALFFVLGLIVVVSTFNVASTLVVLVRERMRDVGVLAALGLRPAELRKVFLIYGGGLGGVGCTLGVALGWTVSWILTRFELIRFDPEMAAIYFIDSVPFRVELFDVLTIVVFTLAVTVVACWLPARRAGWMSPSAALRYE